MQIISRILAILFLLIAALANAESDKSMYVYSDILYWKATEVIDWAYENSLTTPVQDITYKSNNFRYKPGFRIGVGYQSEWDTGIYYTQYTTQTSDKARGNLKSGFFGGTVGLPSGQLFYNSGTFKMNIDAQMVDWYFGKPFQVTNTLNVKPYIGLQAAKLDQKLVASFNGLYENTELIRNDFKGIGPKLGLAGTIHAFTTHEISADLLAGFSTAYLWGHWTLPDTFTDTSPRTIDVSLSDRNMGALALQGMLGVGLTYQNISVKLQYELNDWVAQCQIFDDATGAHNNDLILQGLSFEIVYQGLLH